MYIAERIGSKNSLTIGMLALAGGVGITMPFVNVESTGLILGVPLFLFGAGFGLVYAKVNEVVLAQVPARKVGIGAATLLGVRLLSAAIGAALLSILLRHATEDFGREFVRDNQVISEESRERMLVLMTRTTTIRQDAMGVQGAPGTMLDPAALSSRQKEVVTAIRGYHNSYSEATRLVGGVIVVLVVMGTAATLLIPDVPRPSSGDD